jgi:uncharacterized protein (DUF952 family)
LPDDTIYHIVSRDDWNAAVADDSYRPPSLEAEGFVHCSTRDQVVETANRFFHGQDGLVLLCIDVRRLRTPLRYEPPDMPGHTGNGAQALFPHLYGPLQIDAVVRVLPFPARADGTFALPEEVISVPGATHNPVLAATHITEESAQKLLHFLEETDPVRRLRASQLASGILGAVGFALFVVGVEQAAQDIPVISDPYGSIAVGLGLLVATGLLLRKLSGGP